MKHFYFTLPTIGKFEYMMDAFQQSVCDNGYIKDIVNEIFDSINLGELENADIINFKRDSDYLIIYIEGYFKVEAFGENKESAYNNAIEIWEEADFGVLYELEIND